jgi:hypothetical protein
MRIAVIRTGGFGGLTRRAAVATSDPELIALAEKALAEGRKVRPIGVPDGFSYEIVVDDHAVYCADPHLTDSERTLITRVLKEGS